LAALVEHALFDHLICPEKEWLRDGQPERPRGLEVDDQLESSRLLDGQICGLRAFENLVDESHRLAPGVRKVNTVANQATGFGELRKAYGGYPTFYRDVGNALNSPW